MTALASSPLLDALAERPLMAIVRLQDAVPAVEAAATLADAGVAVIEFSLSSPAALDAIGQARSRLDGRPVLVGAGTVRDEGDAAAAVAAGARFLVSPGLADDVSRYARGAGVPHIPGAMTPTEVQAAMEHQPALVKLFPARALGPGYVKDLLGPFPDVRLLPTGGISAANAGDFLAAGATAVAVSGALLNESTSENPGELAATAAELLAAIERSTR